MQWVSCILELITDTTWIQIIQHVAYQVTRKLIKIQVKKLHGIGMYLYLSMNMMHEHYEIVYQTDKTVSRQHIHWKWQCLTKFWYLKFCDIVSPCKLGLPGLNKQNVLLNLLLQTFILCTFVLVACNFFCFFFFFKICVNLLFPSKLLLINNLSVKTIWISDEAPHFVGPHLDPNCLQSSKFTGIQNLPLS